MPTLSDIRDDLGLQHERVRRIFRAYKVRRAAVFGSVARGEATADSDVDLLVIMQTSASLKERSWAVSRLLLPRPFPVDILVKTPEEIEKALGAKDFFLQEVLTRGQVLYARSE